MSGYIYLLVNSAMPDLVKVGFTKRKDLQQRIKELSNNSSVPIPFQCFYACEIKDAETVEKHIHNAFKDVRINPKREFFKIDPERIQDALQIGVIRDVTPAEKDIVEDQIDIQTIEKERRRRSAFNFSMVNISIGAELAFYKDENLKAKVVDNRQIEFNGEVTSLSGATAKILQKKGYQWTCYHGPACWNYEGESLRDRRKRMENE